GMLGRGVTADQFGLLTVVACEPGVTQTAIVERTGSDPNTVAAILKLLEQRQLVRREAHARDRRARCVFLTAEGRRVRRRAARDAEPLLTALWDCVPDSDRSRVERFLQQVHAVFSSPLAGVNGQSPRRNAKRNVAP